VDAAFDPIRCREPDDGDLLDFLQSKGPQIMNIVRSVRAAVISTAMLGLAGLVSPLSAQVVYYPGYTSDLSEYGRYDADALPVGSGAWWRQMDREGRGGSGNS
jgi:hypothetical protein